MHCTVQHQPPLHPFGPPELSVVTTPRVPGRPSSLTREPSWLSYVKVNNAPGTKPMLRVLSGLGIGRTISQPM